MHIQDKSNTSDKTVLWSLHQPSGHPRDIWNRGQVTIATKQDSQLYIEATVGEPGHGDIAVDTLRFQDGPCVSQPTEAAQTRHKLFYLVSDII